MRHKTLRLPGELSEEITRRARIKGVPDADCTRLLIERGLLLEGVEMAMQASIPPAWWGLCEAVLETRNILRTLAAVRDHRTIPSSQAQAKDELERMKNDGAEQPDNARLHDGEQIAPRNSLEDLAVRRIDLPGVAGRKLLTPRRVSGFRH